MAVRAKTFAGPIPPRKDESLGPRIARIRQERGLSQTDLGERLGVSQRMMSHYEKGQTRIPAETLPKIAEALKVSVNELLGRTPVTRVLKNPRLWKLMQKVDALPPKQQRVVVDMIKVFTRDSNGDGEQETK